MKSNFGDPIDIPRPNFNNPIDIAREYFPNKPVKFLWFVIWEETGYPQFWNIPQDGNTPEECFRKQLKEATTEDVTGTKTTIDFSGGLEINNYWKQWRIDDIFTCMRYTKAGLVLLTDPNGNQIAVAKKHCIALKKQPKETSIENEQKIN